MIQTAEEFKKQYPYLDAMFGSAQEHESVIMLMTEFAKLHVQEALKEAYLKAELKEGLMDEEGNQICYMGDDMGDSWILDKESILKAYNLDNII